MKIGEFAESWRSAQARNFPTTRNDDRDVRCASDCFENDNFKHIEKSHMLAHGPQKQVSALRPSIHPLKLVIVFLPKPSIDPFSGDLLDYWAFVSRYDVNIAGRVSRADLRLAYLLQHCTKEVHEKVKHYGSDMNKQRARERVWKELYERYGQPHIIRRTCEQQLSNVGRISQTDVEGLERLAVLAQRLTSLVSF